MEIQKWCGEEFADANLGDERLTQRLVQLAKAKAILPSGTIPQACRDWGATKAAYRFLDNPKVTPEKILSPHVEQTLLRAKQEPIILAIQDSTSINCGEKPENSGFGKTGKKTVKSSGFNLHATLAVSTSGLPLGLLDLKIWSRTPEYEKKLKEENKKESYKWEDSIEACHKLFGTSGKIVSIGDRECDIFDFYKTASNLGQFFCIRTREHRQINHANKSYLYLLDLLRATPPDGSIIIEVPAKEASSGYRRPAQTARKAEILISFTPVELKSKARGRKEPETVECYAIYAVEKDPPTDEEKIEWVLVTNVPVTTITDAKERISWYKKRWEIEIFFKILKSGCRVETTRLEHYDRLINYVALNCVIGWRLLWMTYMNRINPAAPCTTILADHEWKALYCKIHKTRQLPSPGIEPKVEEVILWIAKLGGFLARKGDGPPGSGSIWRGWQRLNEISDDYLIFTETDLSRPAISG